MKLRRRVSVMTAITAKCVMTVMTYLAVSTGTADVAGKSGSHDACSPYSWYTPAIDLVKYACAQCGARALWSRILRAMKTPNTRAGVLGVIRLACADIVYWALIRLLLAQTGASGLRQVQLKPVASLSWRYRPGREDRIRTARRRPEPAPRWLPRRHYRSR